jgi:hypothetical protein
MTDWARTKTGGNPQALRAGYKLDGSNISGNNYFTTFFASPMAVAAMLNPAHPEWLNALYDSVRTTHEDYYEDSVTLLCLLAISGNFWDPTLAALPPTAYDTWATAAGLNPATLGAPAADPDGDGLPNLLEFALDGDPKDPRQRRLSTVLVPATGAPAGSLLALVTAVRRGAIFTANPDGSQSATVDGITYRALATTDLAGSTTPVTLGPASDTPPAGTTLPNLAGTSWTYQTFSLPNTTTTAFLRLQVSSVE